MGASHTAGVKRFNLLADLAAWRQALRNQRTNPWLAELMRAERRRRAQQPRWQRYALPVCALICTTVLLLFKYDQIHQACFGKTGPVASMIWLVLFPAVLGLLWLVQATYQSALAAVSFLARSKGQPPPTMLDESYAQSRLSDHELLLAFCLTQLPRQLTCSVIAVILLAVRPTYTDLMRYLNAYCSFYYVGLDSSTLELCRSTLQACLDSILHDTHLFWLLPVLMLLSFLAAITSIYLFATLSRGLDYDNFGVTCAIMLTMWNFYLPYLSYRMFDYSEGYISDFWKERGYAAFPLLLICAIPVSYTYLLRAASRLPGLRTALLWATPIVMPIPLIYCQTVLINLDRWRSLYFLPVEAPFILPIGLGQTGLWFGAITGLVCALDKPWFGMEQLWILCIILVPLQLILLYITSIYALAAVPARRSGGEIQEGTGDEGVRN